MEFYSQLKSVFLLRSITEKQMKSLIYFLSAVFFFLAFFFGGGCSPSAFGSSQARDWMGDVAAGLHHSHSKAESATYSTAHGSGGSWRTVQGQESNWVLMDTSGVCYRWATTGTFECSFLILTKNLLKGRIYFSGMLLPSFLPPISSCCQYLVRYLPLLFQIVAWSTQSWIPVLSLTLTQLYNFSALQFSYL